MSELKARNTSELKGFLGSQLQAFGTGKVVEAEAETFVHVTWEVDFIKVKTDTGAILSITPGLVVEHNNYFDLQSIGWAATGKTEMHVYWSKPYNGSRNTLTDKVDTFPDIPGTSSSSFLWNGWLDRTGKPGGSSLVSKPPVVDTGYSIEMYSHLTTLATSDAYPVTAGGCLLYAPAYYLEFDGGNWVRARTLNEIMLYLVGSMSAAPVFATGHRTEARIKATISA